MYNSMHVNFFTRKSRVNPALGSIYVEATVNKDRVVLGAVTAVIGENLPRTLLIQLAHWDANKSRVKAASPQASLLNKVIADCEQRLQKIYAQHEGYDKRMTGKGLKAVMRHGGRMLPSLPDLLDKFLEERKALNTKTSTLGTYKFKFRPLLEFLRHEGTLTQPAEDFTAGSLKRYRTFLITHRNNSERSADKSCQVVKTVFIWAAENEFIRTNPLLYTRIRVDKTPNLECLNQDEVQQVIQAELPADLRRIADCFVFACYTGLAYQDLRSLTPASIQKVEGSQCLVGRRSKTGTDYCIPITEPVWTLIEKYGIANLPLPSNQMYNRALKILMMQLGVQKRITTHTARKTFADWCINEIGMSEEATIVAMGQKNAKELTPYRRTRPKRLLSEFPSELTRREINQHPFVRIAKAC